MIDAARVGGSTPSYTHMLAVLGQYCNQQRARSITLAQVDTGFLLHVFPKGQWKKPASIDLHNANLLELTGTVAGSIADRNGVLFRGGDTVDRKHPLMPMGYDVVLRALGIKLDRRKAVGLTICDTADRLYVNYWVDKATFLIRDGRRQAVSNVQLETYDGLAIQRLVKEANEDFARESARYEHSMRINQYDHITAIAAAFLFESDGKYRDAEAIFHRIAAQVPRHPEAHYHVARLALMRGDRRAALVEVRKALEITPDMAAVHDLHGRILRQGNKLKEAVAAFEQAVSLDEENGLHHYHLSLAYEAQGRHDDALVQLALSTGVDLAPAMEMVQEEIVAEHTALAPQQMAQAAASQEDSLHAEPEPFTPSQTINLAGPTPSWEEPAKPMEEVGLPSMLGVPLPKLTTFNEEALPEDWVESQLVPGEREPLLKPMTLEQRLRAAGALPTVRKEPIAPLPSIPLPSLAAGEPETVSLGWSTNATPLAATTASGDLRIEPPSSGELRSLSAGLPSMGDLPPLPAGGFPPAPSSWAEPEEPLTGLSARLSGSASQPPVPSPTPLSGLPSQAPPIPAGSSNAVELATEILLIQRALEAEPNRAELHRKLGFLLARQGKTAEAAAEFRKALQASRTNL